MSIHGVFGPKGPGEDVSRIFISVFKSILSGVVSTDWSVLREGY